MSNGKFNGGAKEKMKSFRRNMKGISPIFATLILIAIAVIAGVVVYMFTSGTLATMTSGGTAAQEKISVQGSSIVASSGVATLYVEQTSGPAATPNSIIIKDSSGTTLGVVTVSVSPAADTGLASGTMYTITGGAYSGATTLTAGTQYTLTLTTKAGGSFVSTGVVAT